MLAVAPNGARKTQSDHPRLPISPSEIARTAADCQAAGACMLHLHVRDGKQAHSLAATRYRDAIAAIRREAGEDLIIQITTEAVGIYKRKQQMAVVEAVRPEAVSLAVRELCPAGGDERRSAEFFAWLRRERIAPQYILYDGDDIRHFGDLLARGVVPDENVSVLLVLGRYTENQQSDSAEIAPLLARLPAVKHWSLCAFGASEAECMHEAIRLGGHCRVGFENNLLLADGSVATDNAALVSGVAADAATLGRPVATASEARRLLGLR